MTRARSLPIAPATWPELVFDAHLFRGLDERGRSDLRAAARWITTRAGEVLYARDGSNDDVFVVVEGSVMLEASASARLVTRGQLFGAEALVADSRRRELARVRDPGSVVALPARLCRRVLERAQREAGGETEVRRAERALNEGILRGFAPASQLSERAFAELLDAVEGLVFERGARVFEAGASARGVYLMHDGLLELASEHDGVTRVHGYLGPGMSYGAEEVLANGTYACSAVALGRSRALFVPSQALDALERERPGSAEALGAELERRVRAQWAAHDAIASSGDEGVFGDVQRFHVATSLLVIDADSCVRCGHCAWACADRHGTARLDRRGERITMTSRSETDDVLRAARLFVPTACHQCLAPACLDVCPTGAIERSADGVVAIREALCTGCGACAKACPWDCIRMAERGNSAGAAASADVAVKCDLCAGHDEQACVRACPVDAITRIEPRRDCAELGVLSPSPAQSSSRPLFARRSSRPVLWLVSALSAFGLALAWQLRRAGSEQGASTQAVAGLAALVCVLALAYVVPKRVRALGVRPFYIAHLALGLLAVPLVVFHAGLELRASWAGALALGFWLLAASGALCGACYVVVPRALSRLERRATLPEDWAEERTRLFDALEARLSGQDELVKRIAARVLLPYARAPGGALALVVSGRTLSEEQAALGARIERMLQGRGRERLAGLGEVARLAVELRALPARGALSFVLRAWLPLHVVLASVFVALLAVHVLTALRFR